MTHPLPRTALLALISLLVLAWWYASTLAWHGQYIAGQILEGHISPTAFNNVPLSAAPARAAAERLLTQQTRVPGLRTPRSLARTATTLRPLYAPYWLDRARAAYQAGNPSAAERDLQTATRLWPNRADLLWQAAMLRTRMGDTTAALATLRDYLHADPGGYRKALAVAARLEPRPALLLRDILPAQAGDDTTRDNLAWHVLHLARALHNPPLGEAAWQALSPDAQRAPDTARYYTEWMASLDNAQAALAAWSHYLPTPNPQPLENGGFEAPLQAGLGWRIVSPQTGVTIERDTGTAYQGNNSLKLTFPGNENLEFAGVRQYLPVKPASRYTLSFAWRGRGITTRSGPYIAVRARKAGRLARTPDRWGTWDWKREHLSFTAPASEHFVELWIRRDRTDALDNKIAGTLWLDNFKLEAGAGGGENG